MRGELTKEALNEGATDLLMLVSRRLGHASIKTTVDIYGHLFEGAQREAAEKFGKVMQGEE